MKIKDFSKIYFAVLLVHLAALYVGQDARLIAFSKPLIVFSLAAFFWHKMGDEALAITRNRYFIAGLLFSLAGDVASIYSGRQPFFVSKGLFAVAHICYIRSFFGETDLKNGFLKKQPLLILIPVLATGAALWHLWPKLGEARWPVVFYTLVISAMSLSVFNRFGRTPHKNFFAGLFGALLFMASDFLLAQKTFIAPFPHAQVWIMATYGLAQFGLVMGRVGVD